MGYSPENNPRIPGDPYSYDLKWVTEELNKIRKPEEEAAAAEAGAQAAALSAQSASNSSNNAASSESASIAAADSASEDAQRASAYASQAAAYLENIGDEMSGVVADWLNAHVTVSAGVTIDSGLTIPGAAADAAATGDQIEALYDLAEANNYDIMRKVNPAAANRNGVQCTPDFRDNTINLNGTCSVNTFYWVYDNPSGFPAGMEPGGTYFCKYTNMTNYYQVYVYRAGAPSFLVGISNNNTITLPADVDGIGIRLYIPAGTYNNLDLPKLRIYTMPGFEFFSKSQPNNLPGGDLNDVLTNGSYLLIDTEVYTNAPGGIGFLTVLFTGNWHLQIFYPFTGNTIYKRRGNSDGSVWEAWQAIGNGGTNVFNNYDASNTFTGNISAGSGASYLLQSTGDTTDRSAEITALLGAYGYCKLGPGVFYAKDIVMPDGSTLEGSGYRTHLIAETGNAINIKSFCLVKNLRVSGSASTISPDGSITDHNGLVWTGTYTQDQNAPWRGRIENVWIDNFTGSGIYLADTGYNPRSALIVTGCFIASCNVGINIPYWAEFCRFSDISCTHNYYGCINNGGNNIFTSCDFSSCTQGFRMDNSNGQAINNSHGSAIGCTFNHSGSNSGTGIYINGMDSGFMFTGCQIFFSKTQIINSYGIVFDTCNYGLNNCDIEISNGGKVLFSGCIFQAEPAITRNPYTTFANCYQRSGAAVI